MGSTASESARRSVHCTILQNLRSAAGLAEAGYHSPSVEPPRRKPGERPVWTGRHPRPDAAHPCVVVQSEQCLQARQRGSRGPLLKGYQAAPKATNGATASSRASASASAVALLVPLAIERCTSSITRAATSS